jgi:hypothetical protein
MSLDNDKEHSPASIAVAKVGLKDLSRPTRSSTADLKKRDALRRMVKQNTKCEHSSIYSQISFICRRLAVSHEGNKITTEQAVYLIVEAHKQLSHEGLPREVVVEELHKHLDKLEGNNKSLFGVVMANTNSSVHIRRKPLESVDKDEISNDDDKYSENYWADVI